MTRTAATIDGRPAHSPRVTSLDITVLAGGPGVERDVSLDSGRMVRDALERLGHRATLRDIGPEDLSALDIPAQMVFIALHGAFGEDGTVQRILDKRGLVYTGCGVEASALAMDKIGTKAKMIEAGIATPRFDLVKPDRLSAAIETIVPPVMIKPRSSGSSVDTFVARDREGVTRALTTVVEGYGSALVESYVEGPELTVGILGGEALPVCQIRTKREFYDYDAKYLDDDTEYLFDIDLPAELLERVRELSARAFEAIGARDFARVDWMVDRETLEPYVIEINTIPGFTSHSLLPKAASRVGMSFDAFCGRVIELTMQRGGA